MHRYVVAVLAVAALTAIPAIALAKPKGFTAQARMTSQTKSGNNVTFTEKLSIGKRTIGTDKVQCVGTGGPVFKCHGVYTFTSPHGTVKAVGNDDQSKTINTIKITGGTGAFKGAEGTIEVRVNGATSSLQTFHFI
jgi:hypothetical protein